MIFGKNHLFIYNFALKRVAIPAVLLLLFLGTPCLAEEFHGNPPLPILENVETYFKSLIDLNYSMPSIEKEVQNKRGKYVVIFIPGILGSKLTNSEGKTIWGGKAKPDQKGLMLSKDSTYAGSEIMQEYPGFWSRQDIYGKFDNALAVLAAGAATKLEFPYDWRQDLNVVSQKMDEYIRVNESLLRDKDIIFIAHSMGGLVFFNWKNKFYEKKVNDYPFFIDRAILLGSPLKGSCEILRMLIMGYRPVPDAGILEKIGYRYLFKDVQGALFSFPSIFQLIPLSDENSPQNSCLIFRTPTGDIAKNPFDIDVWKILIKLDSVKKVWNKLGIPLVDFENLLKVAKSFRINLNKNLRENRLKDRVLYFYNDTHITTEHVVVKFDEDFANPELVKDDLTFSKNGDGRVLFESAINAGQPGFSRHRLISGHGDLVKDDNFFAFLTTNLNQRIYSQLVKAIAPLTLEDDQATKQLIKARKVLALSDLGENPLEPNEFHDGTKAVLQFDLMVVEALTTKEKGLDLRKRAYEFARYFDDKLKDSKRAIPFYEIAMASGGLKGKTNEVYALNRYGYALLKDNRFQEAETALLSARNTFEISPFNFAQDFPAKLYNNLGNVYLRTNKPINARETLRKASEYGSIKAMATLERLEHQL